MAPLTIGVSLERQDTYSISVEALTPDKPRWTRLCRLYGQTALTAICITFAWQNANGIPIETLAPYKS
jgi:hypothetical protein